MAERRERVVVEFDARGAALVRREIQGVSTASRSAHEATSLLRNSLLLLGGGTLTAILARTSDEYTDIENRIRSVTDSQEEFNQVQAETIAIAERSRTAVADNVLLYQRMRNATSDLFDANGELVFSNQELFRTQELMNKAIIVSGAGQIEASNALRQLTQGLASGALRGDEFRSVSEQIPIVLRFIARELGVAQGELRKYAEEGKITNEVVVNAFLNASGDIDSAFAETEATIGQAAIRLRDNFTKTIGSLNTDTGGSSALADGILLIAENTDFLVKTSLSLGAGYAALKIVESDRLRGLIGMSKAQLAVVSATQAQAGADLEAAVAAGGAALGARNKAEAEIAAAEAALQRLAAERAANQELAIRAARTSSLESATVAERNIALERIQAVNAEQAAIQSRASAEADAARVELQSTRATIASIQAERERTAVLSASTLAEQQAAAAARQTALARTQSAISEGTVPFAPAQFSGAVAQEPRINLLKQQVEQQKILNAANAELTTTQRTLGVQTEANIAIETQLNQLRATEAQQAARLALAEKELAASRLAAAQAGTVEDAQIALGRATSTLAAAESQRSQALVTMSAQANETRRIEAALIAQRTAAAQAIDQIKKAETDAANANARLAASNSLLLSPLRLVKTEAAALFNVIRLHPLGTLAAALAGGATALFLYRDQIKLTSESNVTLGDSLRVLKHDFTSMGEEAIRVSKNIADVFNKIPLPGSARIETQPGGGFLEDFLRSADFFTSPFQLFALPSRNVLGGDIGVFEQQLINHVERVRERTKEIEREARALRDAEQSIERALELRELTGPRFGGNAAQQFRNTLSPEDLKKLTENFGKFRDEMDPVGVAQRELEATTELVNQAIDAQVPGFQAAESILAKYRAEVQRQLDPLADLREELARARLAAGQTEEQQRISARGFQAIEDARRRGIVLTQLDLVMAALYSRGIDKATEANRRHADSKREIEENARAFEQLAESVDPVLRAHAEYARTRAIVNAATFSGSRTAEEGARVWRQYTESVREAGRNEYLQILERFNPDIAKQREYTETTEKLSQLFRARKIDALEWALANKRVEEAYKSAKDPLDEYNESLEDELRLARLSRSEREIQIEIQRRIAEARAAKISEAQLPDSQISLDVRTVFDIEFANQAVDQFRGPQEQLTRLLEVGQQGFIEAGGSAEEYENALRTLEFQALQTSRSLDDGIHRALIGLNADFTDSATQIETVMVNTFRNAEDALVDFFTTGKANAADFFSSLAADLARFVVQSVILAPITGGLSNIFGAVVPNAQGNAFPHGIRMLAQGDILNRPTLAMIAEAGRSEAVLPLERTSNGDLGVKAVIPPAPQVPNVGGGPLQIHVHIGDVRQEFTAPQGMSSADFANMAPQFSQQGFERVIEGAVINVLNKEQRPGGSLNRQLVVN